MHVFACSISSTALSNPFFDSAVREFVNNIAQEAFTSETRAKKRALEKRRNAEEDPEWKTKSFEDNLGDR